MARSTPGRWKKGELLKECEPAMIFCSFTIDSSWGFQSPGHTARVHVEQMQIGLSGSSLSTL